MSKNQTFKIIVGFCAEIFLFFYSGMIFMEGYALTSFFFFFVGLLMAKWVGKKIQEQAVENFKRGR